MDKIYFSCVDILRELSDESSKANIRTKLRRKRGLNISLEDFVPNFEWRKDHWYEFKSSEKLLMVSKRYLSEFCLWALKRQRRSIRQKQKSLLKFGIHLDNIPEVIEEELIESLIEVVPFEIKRSYNIDRYKLDAYIPKLHLAIQIDENGHKNYDKEEEAKMNQVMKDMNISVFRFNPDLNYHLDVKTEFLRQILSKIFSLEFKCFQRVFV